MANGSGIWGMANAYPMDSRDSNSRALFRKTWKEFQLSGELKNQEIEF